MTKNFIMMFLWVMVLLFCNGVYMQNLKEDSSYDVSGEDDSSSSEEEDYGKSKIRTGHIIGGEDTDIAEWPFIVAIYLKNVLYCGGSLITSKWLLTAAHCVEFKTSDLTLVAGETTLPLKLEHLIKDKDLMQVRHTNYVVYHEEYPTREFDRLFDIGLILADSNFKLTEHVQLIPYATIEINHNQDPTSLSDTGTVIGWGATKRIQSRTLRVVTIPLLSVKECAEFAPVKVRKHISEDFICAISPGRNLSSYKGDSGGPLVWKTSGDYILQGIVSGGFNTATKPSLYIRVDRYADWITSKMMTGLAKRAGVVPSHNLRSHSMRSEPMKLLTVLFLLAVFKELF